MINLPMKLVVLGMLAVICTASAQDTQRDTERNREQNQQGVVKQRSFAYGLTLREGYDSNIYTRSSGNPAAPVKGSFNTTASPDFQFGWSSAETDISAHYSYSAVYYQSRIERPWDQSHNLNFTIGHDFSPRLHVTFSDDFAPGFEPDLEEGTSQRAADYIQNTARLAATYTLNGRWDLSTNVRHYFINYDDTTTAVVFPGIPTSQTMNRQAVEVSTAVSYHPSTATTMGVALGYNAMSYTGNNRDNTGETLTFNLQHTFNPRLSADVAAGMQLQTFNAVGGTSINPDMNMGLNYMVTSRTSLGFRFSTRMQPTELSGYLEQQTFMLSGSIVHQFTSKLMGSASVMYVPSQYNGSLVMPGSPAPFTGNNSETTEAGSLTLGYQFNVYLRGEIGYSYTHHDSFYPGATYERHMTYLQARVGF